MNLKIWSLRDSIVSDFHSFYRRETNSTFKDTSLDSSSHTNMCNNTSQEVINFDILIAEKYPDSNSRPKSFDAIYYDIEAKDNKIYLIEFKNQQSKNITADSIIEKVKAGKTELDRMLKNENIGKGDYNFIFCLVYIKYIPNNERYKRGVR